ncbi:MAG: EpsG family protein [Bergeyella zoohelcum]|nr:EpsG family protein [Bergeyella zoohelcum]
MNIVFLHPVFMIVVLALIFFSFMEVNKGRSERGVWIVVVAMIAFIGLRDWIGADYGAYVSMYNYFGLNLGFDEIFAGMPLFGSKKLEVEWLYILLGKWVFIFQQPFYIFTLVVAVICLVLKYYAFENSVVYPSLSMLLYMFPSYFSAEGGHMRQAIAMSIIIFSFIYIKRRNLPMFLLMVFLAMGFHKTSIIFVLAYWVVLVPLNSSRILVLILISVLLSPFQVYDYISLFQNLVSAESYEGFSAYETFEQDTSKVGFTDLICAMYTYFVVTYDREACAKIPYYEYMRNIGVMGICLYFIFKGNPIFSSRLVAIYFIFMVMVIPNIIAAVSNGTKRNFLHMMVVGYAVFYCFVYAAMQSRAGYIYDVYRNHLW